MIDRIRAGRPEMNVLVAMAYMEEAERLDVLVATDAGRILATGAVSELLAGTGAASLEEAFIALLPDRQRLPAAARSPSGPGGKRRSERADS